MSWLRQAIDRIYSTTVLYLIADKLGSHMGRTIRERLEAYPQIQHVLLPLGAV